MEFNGLSGDPFLTPDLTHLIEVARNASVQAQIARFRETFPDAIVRPADVYEFMYGAQVSDPLSELLNRAWNWMNSNH